MSRPLSPHLQVYRPQITSVLSILHRFTGVGLSFGLLFLLCWLGGLCGGESSYKKVTDWFGSGLGLVVFFKITFSFYYHLFNGVRHLFWDMGKGFDMPTVHKTGVFVVVASFLCSLLTWGIGVWS